MYWNNSNKTEIKMPKNYTDIIFLSTKSLIEI